MARFAPICPSTADNLGHELSYFRFPWQIKSILTQTPPAVFLHHITQSRNRHAISKPRCSTIPVNGMRASFFSCKTVPRRTEFYSLSIRRGISIMRSCSSYCGSCDPAIHQPVSKKPLLDGAVRAFRVICCIYTIADFRSAGTSFSRNAVLRERNAERPCPKAKLSAVSLCRFLINRHEKGFPDRKPFHFAILRPVRM